MPTIIPTMMLCFAMSPTQMAEQFNERIGFSEPHAMSQQNRPDQHMNNIVLSSGDDGAWTVMLEIPSKNLTCTVFAEPQEKIRRLRPKTKV